MPWSIASYLINFIWLNVAAYYLAGRPRRWLWWVYALLVISFLCLALLTACKPKAKPTSPVTAPVQPLDSTRIRLQSRADTSRSHADRAANASTSAVNDYETDAKTYDALRNPLP